MIDPPANISLDDADGGAQPPTYRFEHDAMACTFGLHLVSEDARYAQQAARAAFDELDRLEEALSRFIPHSDIARINALTPGQSIRVSIETIECLQLAAQLHTQTNGAFDIAFRSARPDERVPAAESAPRPLVFDPVSHAVGVQVPGVVLDLGGLGKGYALDRMGAVLREWSITAAMLHSGQSAVSALGRPPGRAGWRVGLRHPGQQSEILATLDLCDRALSGSGQRLHGRHIIDPRTGHPAGTTRGAWALAATAAVADALSTALMVMSRGEVQALCEQRPDVSAILGPETSAGQTIVCCGVPVELSEREFRPR